MSSIRNEPAIIARLRKTKFANTLRVGRYFCINWIDNTYTRYCEKKVIRKAGGVVFSGPFKGIRLVNKQNYGAMIAKYLGTYELELSPVTEEIIRIGPKVVANIGSAEGYYAIGFAKLDSVERVDAFDLSEKARSILSENVELNGLSNKISIRPGVLEESFFEYCLSTNVDLLLCDIEGAELDILSSRVIELLSKSIVLIESHDMFRENCTDILLNKFSGSHKLRIISTRDRKLSDFPMDIFASKSAKLNLMNERRGGQMNWLVGTPIKGALP